MTYPQTNGVDDLLNGQDVFRLKTPLLSPGDIYEVETSGLAFAVGPDSDIANFSIVYLDESIPVSLANSVRIGVDRTMVGRIDARMETTYPISQRKGRILIAVDDLYDPTYRPTGFSDVNDKIEFLAPLVDVFEYFNSPPSLVPERSDIERTFKYFQAATATSYLVVPYYGRRYANITVKNENATDANTWGVLGVRYSITSNAAKHYQQTLQAPVAVAAGAQDELIVRASVQGMFDALVLSVSSAGPFNTRITMSDKPL